MLDGPQWCAVSDLPDGQRFAIPDFHGGYGKCCEDGKAAEYVHHAGDIFNRFFSCVRCGEKTLWRATMISTAELR